MKKIVFLGLLVILLLGCPLEGKKTDDNSWVNSYWISLPEAMQLCKEELAAADEVQPEDIITLEVTDEGCYYEGCCTRVCTMYAIFQYPGGVKIGVRFYYYDDGFGWRY